MIWRGVQLLSYLEEKRYRVESDREILFLIVKLRLFSRL
jgi:hypothetical protein